MGNDLALHVPRESLHEFCVFGLTGYSDRQG